MKKLIGATVSAFLFAGCAGGEWRHATLTEETALKTDIQKCSREAKNSVHLGPFPIRTSPAAVITTSPTVDRFKARQEIFESCMVERGWHKVPDTDL
jgi:hypothetical protein